MSESMAKKCQRIWLKVMDTGEEISFVFPDKTTMHRARFAFYDAVRKTKDEKLLEAKEGVEVSVNSKDKTLTLRRKSSNPFHNLFDNQLEDVIENGSKSPLISLTETPEAVPEISVEDSLRRFMEKVEGDSRPNTPYFKRED
jgi:hypothetical protein